MKRKEKIINLFVYFFLFLVLFFVLLPIVYTIAGSFKTNSEIMAYPERIFPSQPTLDNYISAFGNSRFNLPKLFFNSCWYTFMTMMITVGISLITGYVFARGEFPGKKLIFALFSSLMFVSIGNITIYPIFDILNELKLSSSLWGLIFLKIFGVGIVNIYLVRSFIWTLPKELDEAALLDGCGFVKTFFYIYLPLLKPVIATLCILAFQSAWNDYLMPTLFTMGNPDQQTLMVAIVSLKGSGSAAANWNLMLAGATAGLIPILVIYAVFNKYFVKGIAAGAVKG